MSSKRPSLAETMRLAATPPDPAPSPVAAEIRPRGTSGREIGFYAATRVGKKKVTATLSPADHKRLRQLALEHDATTEALLTEAINDLFAKYDRASARQGKGAA